MEVKRNSTDVNEDVRIRRTQEEADTKIIVSMKHCLLSGFKNLVVKTRDTDVVTLLLFSIHQAKSKLISTLGKTGFARLATFAQELHLSNSLY